MATAEFHFSGATKCGENFVPRGCELVRLYEFHASLTPRASEGKWTYSNFYSRLNNTRLRRHVRSRGPARLQIQFKRLIYTNYCKNCCYFQLQRLYFFPTFVKSFCWNEERLKKLRTHWENANEKSPTFTQNTCCYFFILTFSNSLCFELASTFGSAGIELFYYILFRIEAAISWPCWFFSFMSFWILLLLRVCNIPWHECEQVSETTSSAGEG